MCECVSVHLHVCVMNSHTQYMQGIATKTKHSGPFQHLLLSASCSAVSALGKVVLRVHHGRTEEHRACFKLESCLCGRKGQTMPTCALHMCQPLAGTQASCQEGWETRGHCVWSAAVDIWLVLAKGTQRHCLSSQPAPR